METLEAYFYAPVNEYPPFPQCLEYKTGCDPCDSKNPPDECYRTKSIKTIAGVLLFGYACMIIAAHRDNPYVTAYYNNSIMESEIKTLEKELMTSQRKQNGDCFWLLSVTVLVFPLFLICLALHHEGNQSGTLYSTYIS